MASSKTIKILHLRSSEFFGGPERAIIGQCLHLPDFEFHCASFGRPDSNNDFLNKAAEVGLKTLFIPEAHFGDLRIAEILRLQILEKNILLIVSHDFKSHFIAWIMEKCTPALHIRHFRGATAEDMKMRFYNVIDRMLLRRMHHLLVVSNGTKNIVEGYGVTNCSIQVVPNAIEENKLLQKAKVKFQPGNKPVRGIAAGRLSHEKGYDTLMMAIAEIKEYAPPFVINIFGEGPEDGRLRNMVAKNNLSSFVNYCGFSDNILAELNQADFLVLPSRSEGMPNVLLEAWSQRLGVIATAVGGVPEMVEHGENGLLCPSENPFELGKQILFAVQNPDRMYGYGEAGFELVKTKFSYASQSTLLDSVYRRIISSNPDFNGRR